MPEILATIGAVIELGRKLLDASAKLRDAELKNLIADLNLKLADLKMQLAEVQEENLRLKGELKQAGMTADIRSKLSLRDGAYILSEPPAGRSVGPYCTRCFDVAEKLVLLGELTGGFAAAGKYLCPNCNAFFGK